MAEIAEDVQMDSQDIEQETPPEDVFMAPSIHKADELAGKSYSHFSEIPKLIADDMSKEVVLGVDEAGRGPVLGRPLLQPLYTKTTTDNSRPHGLCTLLLTDRTAPLAARRHAPL
jgi:ribonuclease H2 subunit A